MGGLQSPIINWQVKAGDSEAGFAEQRILLIAQGSGTAEAKTLLEDVQQNEIVTLCGANSLATLAFNRLRTHNKVNEIDIITLETPIGATKAQGGITFTGIATENKTLTIVIGDKDFDVSITVVEDDTGAEVATKAITAINAKDYPFTASIDGEDDTLVLIDFDIAGEMGNGLIVEVKDRVLGLTITTTEFTGGAGAYDAEDIFVDINKRYQTVIFDNAVTFSDVETWLESRINTTNAVKGGVGITMLNGSLSEVKAIANAKNSKSMVIFGNIDEIKYNALPLLAVAEVGAKRALRLTDGAVLGDLVIEAVEAYGGINKSSLPYHNTPISYDAPNNEITIEQVQDLNDAGVSLFVPATIGVVLGSVVTLYKYDGAGIEDSTFHYLNAVDTSLAVQEYLYNNTKKEFAQTRATGGDLVAGVAMTNELSVKSYIVGLYDNMVNMALVQGGVEAIKAFKRDTTVTLDVASGVYSIFAPTAIVSQLRGINGVVAISYKFK